MSNDVEKLKDIELKIDDLAIEIDGQGTALDSIDEKMDDGTQKSQLYDINNDVSAIVNVNGNQRVSINELAGGVSSNSNAQLNTTLFDSTGLELKLDSTSGAIAAITYPHKEIHIGTHYFSKDYTTLASGATYDFLLVTPANAKWGHFIYIMSFESESNLILYEDTEASSNGTPMPVFNRQRNSETANGLLLFHTPTVTDVGDQILRAKGGSGKQIGGVVRDSEELISKQSSKYLFRVHNDTSSNNWLDWLIDWYEHTNS